MANYIGTGILDVMLTCTSDLLSGEQEYLSFFKDETCTRLVVMGDIFINLNDLFFRYVGMENDISYWCCDEAEFCICVDENLKIFVKQSVDIIRERNIDGLDSVAPLAS